MGKIVGEKLLPYVADQINLRQEKHGLISRDVEALTYLNSKTAWLKLASAVEITPERLAKEEFRPGFAWNKLAKDYVLFGGISHLEGDKLEQLQSILFSGNSDGMYDVSASDKQAREFGLVPMPGLESAEVKSLNRGSIKEANITIKCYSPEQFRILDLLYLRIGYTLFLEWGWSTYFDNNGKLETNYFSLIEDPNGFFNSSWKKKSYLPFLNKIEATREAKDGNYDGLLCRVTNFSWTFNNGVYDINLKCISLGDVVESLKTNITPSYNVSKFIEDQYAIFQDGEEVETNKGISPSPVNNVISAYIFLQKIFLLSNANNGGDKYHKLREVPHKAKGFPKDETMSLGSVFIKPGDVDGGLTYLVNNQIFKNHSQRDAFIEERLSGGTKLDRGLLEDAVDILNEKTQPGTYYILTNALLGERNRIYYKIIPDLTSLNTKNRQDTDVFFLNYNNMITDEDVVLDEGFYFRFGHIMDIINEKIITRIKSSNTPLLGIDTGQWSNYMYTFPYQVSLDPRICLVRNPPEEPINSKEFIISASPWKDSTKDYAWTMNIYLNGKFITDTISNNIDENGDISLFSFLSTICTELNKALGGVNNLEPVIDEDENKIYIVDGSYSETEKSSDYQLELYGYNGKQSNFVKDVSIKTELTNDFATMATVGSTAGGYVKGVENTMFSKWNKGLIDRFKEKLVPANKSSREGSEGREEPHEAYFKEFWNRVYSPFGVTFPQDIPDDYFTQDQPALNNEIIDKNIAIVTEFYKYCHSVIQSKYEKYASPTNGFIPISLNTTFDGLSGIKIYNAINVDTRFLPPNYPEALKFIIKGVNHKISQNNWDTTIDTVVIANNVNEKGVPILPYNDLRNEVKKIIAGGKALATEDTFATAVKDAQRTIVENFKIPLLKVKDLTQFNRKIPKITNNIGWEAEAANFIALKEGFTKIATWDVNHYRGGFGSDKIFRNNKLITVTKGTIFTKEEAVQTLEKYSITTYSNPIIEAIGNSNWEKLNNHQKAALVSLGYNVGAYYMTKREYGKKIAKAIKANNYQEAAQGILDGPKTADGEYFPSLARRRKEEAQLFLYPSNKSIY
jgi:GH24 family phage-related lysozyme (muramidase)